MYVAKTCVIKWNIVFEPYIVDICRPSGHIWFVCVTLCVQRTFVYMCVCVCVGHRTGTALAGVPLYAKCACMAACFCWIYNVNAVPKIRGYHCTNVQ